LQPKVLMLAWEYPPDHVGGLGRHVYHLSHALVQKGAEVTVLTRGTAGKPKVRIDDGVKVVCSVPYALHPPEFVTWAVEFNVSLLESAGKFLSTTRFDLIHAHDWIVAYAARALKHWWDIPLVATVHATEIGRQKGLHTPVQHHISETEWWLCYEAWRVITCSHYMADEVRRVFNVPEDKIDIIPNGISKSWFLVQRDPAPEPLIIYVGRLVPEKGPHVLIEAMTRVLEEFPSATLVLAGSGPLEAELHRRVYEHGLGRVVHFAGHLGDSDLETLYSKAWVAAFPSSYEPFGIVALEAMATGVSCIVGDVGGLREIVDHGYTGIKVEPENPGALAESIKVLLRDPARRRFLSDNARESSRVRYSWDDIADRTIDVYQKILEAKKRITRASSFAAAGDHDG